MIIKGYAFKSDEDKRRDENLSRYEEIKHLAEHLQIKKTPEYGRTKFTGVLGHPGTEKLTEFDLALIADRGNLCFGGKCTICGNTFSGDYWVD